MVVETMVGYGGGKSAGEEDQTRTEDCFAVCGL